MGGATTSAPLSPSDDIGAVQNLHSPSHPDPSVASADREVQLAWDPVAARTAIEGYTVEVTAGQDGPVQSSTETTQTALTVTLDDDGTWQFRVWAHDAAGAAGPAAVLTVTVDAEAPAVPVVTSTHRDGVPNSARTLVAQFESGDGDQVSAWAVLLDGQPDSVPDPGTAQTQPRFVSAVQPGTHWLHVAAQDPLGRWGDPAHLQVVVAEAEVVVDRAADTWGWSEVEVPVIVATDDLSGLSLATVDQSGALRRIGAVGGSGRVDWDPSAADADGRVWPDGGYQLVVLDDQDEEVSARVTVQVAVDSTVLDRIWADYRAGVITASRLGELMSALLSDPTGVPAGYRDGSSGWGLDTAALLRVLGSLAPQDRDTVAAALVPAPSPAPGPSARARALATPSCDGSSNPMFAPLKCTVSDAHFTVSYAAGGVTGGGSTTQVPVDVTRMLTALNLARDTFIAMGFAVPDGATSVYLVAPQWPLDPGVGYSEPFTGSITMKMSMDPSSPTSYSLPTHEFFHQVQYGYISVFDQGSEPYWWMEATAEWATHRAQEHAAYPAAERNGHYASNLAAFLSSAGPLHMGENSVGSPGGAEYGSFVLAEFLEERFGGDEAIRWIWDRMGDGAFGVRPLDAIAEQIRRRGGSYPEAIELFRQSTYVLAQRGAIGFGDPDAAASGYWRSALRGLSASVNTYRRVTDTGTLSATSSASGAVAAAASNAAYLELAVPRQAGYVHLHGRVKAGDVQNLRASSIPVDTYPALCGEAASSPLDVTSDGGFDAVLAVPAGCRTLTVVLTNAAKSGVVMTMDWSADWHRRTLASDTVDLAPAVVGTLAGGGTTVADGVGAEAGFAAPRGMHVVGRYGYVFDSGYLRRVDLATGSVSAFAGSGATTSGCTDSSDPSKAKLAGGPMTDDGSFLYFVQQCGTLYHGVRKVSLATGAVTTLTEISRTAYSGVTIGPDGALYAARGRVLSRIDLSSGAITDAYTLPGAVLALTSDESNFWLRVQKTSSTSATMRLNPWSGASTEIADELINLTSAGTYLYGTRGYQVLRVTKATGEVAFVAGQREGLGYQDGVGTDAWFDSLSGLASDGTRLYATDAGNHRIRTLTAVDGPAMIQPPTLSQTVEVSPAVVSTLSDGLSTTARGLHVVGDVGYVVDSGYLRRVDLTTGQNTVFAGSGSTSPNCTDSLDPTAANLGGSSLTDDGHFLYFTQACGSTYAIRRVSLATGAVSTIVNTSRTAYSSVVIGPDNELYAARGAVLARIDVGTGTSQDVHTLTGEVLGMTADQSVFWLRVKKTSSTSAIVRLNPETGVGVEFPVELRNITSAGDYLYGTLGYQVLRMTKATGQVAFVAGQSEGVGYQDGVGADAWFDSLSGLASDGTRLYATDAGNHRIRALGAADAPTMTQPPALSQTVSLAPATVGTLTSGLSSPRGMQVIDGSGYVVETGYLRRIDLTTGQNTVFAGSGSTSPNCTDSLDPTAANLGGSSLTDDGHFLYFTQACGSTYAIRRVSLATGAVSTIVNTSRTSYTGLVIGPDGNLYAARGAVLSRIDVGTGTSQDVHTFTGEVQNLTADSSRFWLRVRKSSSVSVTVRFDPQTDTATDVGIALANLTSAGDYLYGSSGRQVLRMTKATGAVTVVAGHDQEFGDRDGVGTEARFDSISALVSDGARLYAVDTGNGRVRVLQ